MRESALLTPSHTHSPTHSPKLFVLAAWSTLPSAAHIFLLLFIIFWEPELPSCCKKSSSHTNLLMNKPEQIICWARGVFANLFRLTWAKLVRWHRQTSHGTPDYAEEKTNLLRKLPLPKELSIKSWFRRNRSRNRKLKEVKNSIKFRLEMKQKFRSLVWLK